MTSIYRVLISGMLGAEELTTGVAEAAKLAEGEAEVSRISTTTIIIKTTTTTLVSGMFPLIRRNGRRDVLTALRRRT